MITVWLCHKTGNRSIKNNRNVMIPIKYSYRYRQRNTTQKSYNITSVLFIVVDVDIYKFTHFVYYFVLCCSTLTYCLHTWVVARVSWLFDGAFKGQCQHAFSCSISALFFLSESSLINYLLLLLRYSH